VHKILRKICSGAKRKRASTPFESPLRRSLGGLNARRVFGPTVKLDPRDSAQKLNVDVRASPFVVSEIVAGMIRIFVDHDIVAVPVPAIAKLHIVRRDAEIKSVEPET